MIEILLGYPLNDFVHFEVIGDYLGSDNPYYSATDGGKNPRYVAQRWCDIFDYCYDEVPGGVFATIQDPGCTGAMAKPRLLQEEAIRHMMNRPGVWFTTCREVPRAYRD